MSQTVQATSLPNAQNSRTPLENTANLISVSTQAQEPVVQRPRGPRRTSNEPLFTKEDKPFFDEIARIYKELLK